MASSKVVRTVCCFRATPAPSALTQLHEVAARLEAAGYSIQTQRLCTTRPQLQRLPASMAETDLFWGVGALDLDAARQQLHDANAPQNVSFHLDLTAARLGASHVDFLFEIMCQAPAKTFNFAYVFNNRSSSPYFPSARYERDGFSIGLQPTDLAEGCTTLDAWLNNLQHVWEEIDTLFRDDPEFLGIDASVAPLFSGHSSLIHFIKRLGMSFAESCLTDVYLAITDYVKTHNPRPVGLCGLMFPCLEDFDLAAEYEAGRFSLERNLYLSLHCGLGIDTYPIGIDEHPQTVLHILRLLQRLSNRYDKPLSARFVSDGQAKIGARTHFGNPYLKDVTIRALTA
jgi:hypothetical protein